MNAGAQLLARLFGKRIARETKRHLVTVAHERSGALRTRSSIFLRRLAEEPGPHAVLGKTPRGETFMIPTALIATSWGFITGGTGSGKSMAAMALI